MNVRTYLVLLATACLVIGGCTIPSISVNIEPGQTPGGEAMTPPLEEITPLVGETPASEPPTSEPEAPAPTNTLVVPPAPEETPAPEPPGAAPTEEPGGEPPEGPDTPSSPVPTAIVDPELAALWDWAMSLEEEVAEPLQEMVETLEGLGLGGGDPDIFAICTGVDVVVATLAEVQQGLETVGPPPVDDPDLQLAYTELSAALDDLEQGFQLLQAACETMNPGAAIEALGYLESGAQHMENAAEAIERWENKVGL